MCEKYSVTAYLCGAHIFDHGNLISYERQTNKIKGYKENTKQIPAMSQ